MNVQIQSLYELEFKQSFVKAGVITSCRSSCYKSNIMWCCFISGRSSPPMSPRAAAPYLPSHPGAAQPVVSISPESAKKYRNPATIPETFSTTVDSRGSHSNSSSRSSSQSSLSLASTLSPHHTGGMNVGRLEPLLQTPSEGDDTGSELFSPTT